MPSQRSKKGPTSEPDLTSLFTQSIQNKYVPRSLFVDLEPTVIGTYRHLFNHERMIKGKEDAANNYSRGFYSVGSELIDLTMERLRNATEICDNLQCFLIFHSFGGGTGSGFTALLLDQIQQEFGRLANLEMAIYPTPRHSSAITEPYNTVLMTHSTLDIADCSFIMDNAAISNICTQKLNIVQPTYDQLNRLVAKVISTITSSMRFGGQRGMDMHDLLTNIVPYPRVHFPVLAFAPITTPENANHENLSTGLITNQCFEPDNQMASVDPRAGKLLSCCLLYRGDVFASSVNKAIMGIKTKTATDFVDWCPTGFKVSICDAPPLTAEAEDDMAIMQRAVCLATNTTAIADNWSRVNYKFDLMFQKRAFVHWYLNEGMDLDEMIEARENVEALNADYHEIESEFISHDLAPLTNSYARHIYF